MTKEAEEIYKKLIVSSLKAHRMALLTEKEKEREIRYYKEMAINLYDSAIKMIPFLPGGEEYKRKEKKDEK